VFELEAPTCTWLVVVADGALFQVMESSSHEEVTRRTQKVFEPLCNPLCDGAEGLLL